MDRGAGCLAAEEGRVRQRELLGPDADRDREFSALSKRIAAEYLRLVADRKPAMGPVVRSGDSGDAVLVPPIPKENDRGH